jgi:hypothetical protein
MQLIQSTINPDTVLVRVDSHELVCDGGKPLPYPTFIGTISRDTGKIGIWMPAAYTPRGYRSAAKRILEEQAKKLQEN